MASSISGRSPDAFWRSGFKGALLDLDGTLFRGHQVIEGAPSFVEALRTRGIQPVFFTNNSSRTPAQVAAFLSDLGIRAREDEVATSAQAAAAAIRRRLAQPTEWEAPVVAFVGGTGLEEALRAEKLDPRRARADELRAEWVHRAQAVAVGLAPDVCYGDLALLARVAHRVGWMVLTNPDRRLPVEDGFMPGNGAIGAFVQTASSAEVLVTGKPDVSFVRYALERFGLREDEVVIVGDNVETDVEAGKAAGVATVWVRSGLAGEVDPAHPPEWVIESVASLLPND
ncbi:HAD-IIA family hydrolase [Alicyclobacillus vulcanalis]|uniref:Haloacid Dehalogenase Superfamily Class (Subfamily) IIA/haloacid dehalogenase superfamily, subfamily IA, variant 3 with third motif having DD or ED n=1 Tax=Alicyclobacillus vulcanalis TaxID=252246 RepID=A0A1N7KTV0_9BACL|nr:HAD-IIA family hydrolase [Alicyclobacillus vulcanalis]SIS64984.1 Haloacid Dehalogenase Superfamily Class (subfamily) IIA/haloacid dehalogenase superfamily, subfamily IA, variant 3 with third motif having DD or ED [Alicyclobacillus vulcanalis]